MPVRICSGTSDPNDTTVAPTSCPKILGYSCNGNRPLKPFRSPPQNPTIPTSSSTSPALGTGSSTSRTSVFPTSVRTKAFINIVFLKGHTDMRPFSMAYLNVVFFFPFKPHSVLDRGDERVDLFQKRGRNLECGYG